MTTDIKPVALAASSVAAFTEAMRGPKGTLDAWLEDNNEAEVRAHVEAYAEQAIDSLRAEVEAWRELSDHVRAGACNAIWPDRYTDARTRDVAAALNNAEQLAEALRLIAAPIRPDGTWNRDREACRQIARAALRDHDQVDGN